MVFRVCLNILEPYTLKSEQISTFVWKVVEAILVILADQLQTFFRFEALDFLESIHFFSLIIV